MYKKQLVFQKYACLLAVIAAAVSFVYSLGIITDIYDTLYSTMMNPNDLTQTFVPGSIIYYDMQEFNRQFTNISIVLILTACLLYLTNTQVRRKYYIGNYAAIGIYSVATIGVTLWSHLQISAFKTQFLTTVDFEALKAFAEMWNKPYSESTLMLDLHYVVAALAIISVAALIGNMVWKIQLMKAEDALIGEGKEAVA
ncbi:MAG: hypothetical protein E7465_02385 [Ruminococcaceae bacterium]|nr:hypothetical protein [Oscillospiraceae bacterium]